MEITDLEKSFGSVRVLNGVSLTIKSNSILGLAGGNGAGKSTLAKCVAGHLKHEAGRIERNGVVALLADWTNENKQIEQALAGLNSRSIPLLAIYPGDAAREVIVLPDLLSQADVMEALTAAGPSLDVKRAEVTAEQGATNAPAAPEFGALLPIARKR